MDPSVTVRALDLRQLAWCERHVFHSYSTLAFDRETSEMQEGLSLHLRQELLEDRRDPARYGLAGASRAFDVKVSAPLLGVHGRIDMLLLRDALAWPVEYKPRASCSLPGDLLQLCAYGLAIEELMGTQVTSGFWMGSSGNPQPVMFDRNLRRRTLGAIARVREIMLSESFPPAAKSLGSCERCQFVNACGDVR